MTLPTQAQVMRAVKAALEPARVLGWSQGDAEAMAAVYIQDEAL